MKRRTSALSFLVLACLAGLASLVGAQDEVLKPFRPGRAEPARPPANDTPATRPADGTPLKPFRGTEEPPKAQPVKPKPPKPVDVEEAPIPKAVPVKRPPVGDPAIPPNPTKEPAKEPMKEQAPPVPGETPKPAERPSANENPEPGDIVVKPGVTPTTPDQVQLQFADNYYARKQWRDAAPEYETFIQRYPNAPASDRQAAMYRLAEAYRQMGSVNNAKLNYDKLLSTYAGGEFVGYASYRLASLLYDEKQYREALPIYRRASVRLIQPTLVNASKFFVGRCLEAGGQKNDARMQYEVVAGITEGNPYRDASRLSVGRLLEDLKDREAALKWLLPLAKETVNPQIKAEALTRAGLLQLEVGKPDLALETMKTALALPEAAPSRNDLHVGIFKALYEKKDFKGVLERYESGTANELNAESKLNVLVVVANSHRELGQRDASMALYDQISRDYGSTPQARDASYARLVMLYDTGDQRLLEEVNKFLTDNPTAPQADRVSLMKAEALFKAADFENAALAYQEIVEKARGLKGDFKGEAAFKLGWCWMQLRQYEKALPVFTAFLKDYPLHAKVATALAQLGAAQMQLKQYSAAQKTFEELTTKHPKSKEMEFGLENLALIHGQLGDQARMAATFEKLLQTFPESAAKAKAHYWIGRAAFDRKDYKKAAPHLDQARQLDKEQFFKRASVAILICYFNMEQLEATEKEIEFYKSNGGETSTPTEVVRWVGQKYYEQGKYDNAVKHLTQLVVRKEATADDFLLLARARAKMYHYKEAVESFDSYLAIAKEPVLRVAGLIEKTDAQIGLKDWDAAEKTAKDGLVVATEGKYNGELRLRVGEIEVGRGNSTKALQIFEAIPVTLEDDDICPRALERAIQIRRNLGQDQEVKRLENQLRSKYPEYLQKKKKVAQP
jgi:tetratricopeptide (TPR) repeat protein